MKPSSGCYVVCFLSAVLIPVGAHLPRQRDDAVVFSLLCCDAGQAAFDITVFDQKTHAAAEFTLDSPGGRSDPVFHIVLQEKIPKSQTLLIVYKQDVPSKVRIKH
jgi:hypothetical protein